MSRLALMTAIMALAAVDLTELREESPKPKRQGIDPIPDPILPQPGPEPDPQAERVRREARERRRQNFLKRQK